MLVLSTYIEYMMGVFGVTVQIIALSRGKQNFFEQIKSERLS